MYADYLINSVEQNPSWKGNSWLTIQKQFRYFMEPKSLLSLSQKLMVIPILNQKISF
jgi:hypothetical protein